MAIAIPIHASIPLANVVRSGNGNGNGNNDPLSEPLMDMEHGHATSTEAKRKESKGKGGCGKSRGFCHFGGGGGAGRGGGGVEATRGWLMAYRAFALVCTALIVTLLWFTHPWSHSSSDGPVPVPAPTPPTPAPAISPEAACADMLVKAGCVGKSVGENTCFGCYNAMKHNQTVIAAGCKSGGMVKGICNSMCGGSDDDEG